jgi:hypothetical protein
MACFDEVLGAFLGLTLLHAVFTLGISAAITNLPPDLDRETVVKMLQEKCREIDGKAVMNVRSGIHRLIGARRSARRR